jgi:phage baseplate assembly protein V
VGGAGRYVLAAATHTVDPERGYLTELSTSPPEPLARSAAPAAALPGCPALGLVSRVDDPAGAGRVRVELPAHGGLETDWLEVLCAGAGPGKGFVALPDVGDRVLLLAPGGDFAQALVLGGLYGPDGPPDAGVEGGRVARSNVHTAAGQRLLFDGTGRRVRIEDGAGSWIELGPERVEVHAAADLTIEAPGRRLLLRAERIDFERG